jgi:hypothetical protein
MELMKPMREMKPMAPMKPMSPPKRWWPEALGEHPDSTGGQNQSRYAFFQSKRRLVVDTGDGDIQIYDTADHQISGVQQEQGTGEKRLIFSSQLGKVALDRLGRVSG